MASHLSRAELMRRRDRARGCFVGLAVGDAIGRPVEGQGPAAAAAHARACLRTLLERHDDDNNPARDKVKQDGHGPHAAWLQWPAGAVDDGMPFGQVTDDTQLACCLGLALLGRVGGAAADAALAGISGDGLGFCGGAAGPRFAAGLVRMLRHGLLLGIGTATRAAVGRLAAVRADDGDGSGSGSPGTSWRDAGSLDAATNGAAMRVAPVALAFCGRDADRLAKEVRLSCVATHRHPHAVAAAAAVAAGIARLVCLPGGGRRRLDRAAFVAHIARAAAAAMPGGEAVAEGLARLTQRPADAAAAVAWLDLEPREAAAQVVRELDEFWRPGDGGEGDDGRDAVGVSGSATASVVWAVYCFLRTPDDYAQAVATAISAGGDTDTAAAMAGALAGAYIGLDGCGLDDDDDGDVVEATTTGTPRAGERESVRERQTSPRRGVPREWALAITDVLPGLAGSGFVATFDSIVGLADELLDMNGWEA
ncbi:hypothetical protein HK405_007753 [Cladochytrium tenue]|nr:hypothetical protein HK405_007753 [Cladochytrium tenue]